MWIKVNLMEDKNKLSTSPAVYAIYFDGDLVYIGSSNNIRNRFSGHAFRYGYGRNIYTPWQDLPDSVVISMKYRMTKKLGEWAMREIRLISKLRPFFNFHHKGRTK